MRTGEVEGQLLDFYIIVDDYRGAYGNGITAALNWLIPPNVYYFEDDIDGVRVRAKYAVLSRGQFLKLACEATFNPAIWARFAQPISLAYCRDKAARRDIVAALGASLQTLLKKTLPLAPSGAKGREIWRNAFALTYGTEFRAERGGRPGELYDLSAGFYERVEGNALPASEINPNLWVNLAWTLRRIQGRVLHILRLVKAAATFDGGIDYLAWKIERHSGVAIEIKPWYRRHPVLAGLYLLPRLKGRGAIR